MNKLEERYRRVLRMLPAAYRRRWEDEMVESYLDSVETDDPDRAEFLAEFGRPAWSEVASIVGLSIRLRLGLAGPPSAGAAAWGAAVRFVGLAWVLTGAAWAVAIALRPLWTAMAVDWWGVAPVDYAIEASASAPVRSPMVDLTRMVWQFAPLAWIIVFAALLLGRPRPARIVAVVLVAYEVIGLVVAAGEAVAAGAPTFWEYAVPPVLLDLCLLWILWAFRPDQPRPRWRPWALAFLAGVAVSAAVMLAALVVVSDPSDAPVAGLTAADIIMWAMGDSTNLYVAFVVLAAALHGIRGGGRDPARSLGLALLAGVVVVQRLVTLPVWASGVGSVILWASAVEVAVLVLVAWPLFASAAGRLRSPDGGAATVRTP